jgi:protoporphyrinogen oxidase
MSATFSRGCIRYDLGPHAFYYLSGEVKGILDAVLEGSPLVYKSRAASFFIKGRHVSYPLKFFELIISRNFSVKDAFLALLGYASARIKNLFRKNQPRTLQEFGYSAFGRYLYSMTLEKIYKKTWGVSTSLLSPCMGEHPSSKMNLFKLLSAAMRIKDDSYAALYNKFFYHPEGIGEPFLRLGAKIQKMGGRIIYEADAVGLTLQDGKVKSVIFQKDNTRESIEADSVVSTIPLIELYHIVKGIERPQRLQSDGLEYRNLIMAYFVLDAVGILGRQVTYFLDDDVVSRRVFEQKRYSEKTVPPDKTLLGFEYFCSPGDSLWNASEDELRQTALRDLQRLLGARYQKPADFFVHRIEHAYPVYRLDYDKRFSDILEEVNAYASNLVSTGRGGLFLMTNIDESMGWGLTAAEHLAEHDANSGWLQAVKNKLAKGAGNIC